MRALIFYSILLFFCGKIYAQTIRGSVVESGTGTPVENVIVEISETGMATKTKKDGSFFFNQSAPEGDHVLTISKKNYQIGYFLLKSKTGKPVTISTEKGVKIIDKMEIIIDKYEASRRKKATKIAAKEESKKLKATKKEKKIRDKLLAKKLKKLQKNKPILEPVVENQQTSEEFIEEDIITFSEAQYKYAQVLGVPIEELTNKVLYDFIAEWEGTPYLLGGADENGIDCSAFTQRLFQVVNNQFLERTAHKQYKSRKTDTFTNADAVVEGDLIFFSRPGALEGELINHVGVYLHNNMFVSATSKGGRARGVKITDLSTPYWQSRFISFGRRINNK